MWVKDLRGERICCVPTLFLVGLILLLSGTNLYLLVFSLLKDIPSLFSKERSVYRERLSVLVVQSLASS